jgi:lactoylglutathione lyase
MKAEYIAAWPYQGDRLNLPVEDLEVAVPFYQTTMGFTLKAENDGPPKSAILARDGIEIGLAENGGDPTQDGCFFEVDDVERAFAELKANGLPKDNADYRIDKHGATSYRVFFVVAPDGLCYCLGQRL